MFSEMLSEERQKVGNKKMHGVTCTELIGGWEDYEEKSIISDARYSDDDNIICRLWK